jgi:hypothetical protein
MCLELLNSHGMRFHFKKKKISIYTASLESILQVVMYRAVM